MSDLKEVGIKNVIKKRLYIGHKFTIIYLLSPQTHCEWWREDAFVACHRRKKFFMLGRFQDKIKN